MGRPSKLDPVVIRKNVVNTAFVQLSQRLTAGQESRKFTRLPRNTQEEWMEIFRAILTEKVAQGKIEGMWKTDDWNLHFKTGANMKSFTNFLEVLCHAIETRIEWTHLGHKFSRGHSKGNCTVLVSTFERSKDVSVELKEIGKVERKKKKEEEEDNNQITTSKKQIREGDRLDSGKIHNLHTHVMEYFLFVFQIFNFCEFFFTRVCAFGL
jgi:hypothetical protein